MAPNLTSGKDNKTFKQYQRTLALLIFCNNPAFEIALLASLLCLVSLLSQDNWRQFVLLSEYPLKLKKENTVTINRKCS